MEKIKTKKVIYILSVVLIICSCTKNYDGYNKSKNGLYYKFHTANDGSIKNKKGDIVTLHTIYRIGNDTTLYNSFKNGQPIRSMITDPVYQGDVVEGFAMLQENDSVTFITSADSFFLKMKEYPVLPKFVKKRSDMYITVKVLEVQTKEDFEEERKQIMAQQRAYIEYQKRKEEKNNQ